MAEQDWLTQECFMMFPGNYTWSSGVLNILSSALWGGGEIGEIYKVCSALKGKEGDNAAWFAEWNAMGERVAALGEKAESERHLETASSAFMRAAHYIQVGERQRQPRTPETQKAYARSIALFKRGVPNVPFYSIEPVEVPFENGKSLPAYFVKQKGERPGTRWPTVVFFDGHDNTKEMCFFKGTLELVKRGMACLVIDGPGNGESIRFRMMPMRYDANVAGTAAVDYLEGRNDVDKERIGVMGVSLGGYFAPRCAAFEKRYKACVAWGAQWDAQATWKRRIEKQFKTAIVVPGEHIKWAWGADTFDEVLEKMEKVTLKDVAKMIECPILIVHGEADAQQPMEVAHNLFEAVGSKDKTLRVFTREEGGAQHCTRDNHTIGTACIGDWLVDRLIRGVRGQEG
jgi:dienelactone hydrolase